MAEGEMLKFSVEEFSRVKGYMLLTDRNSDTSGVNPAELDRIKE